MFGIFMNKKEIASEIAAEVTKNIRSEHQSLINSLSSLESSLVEKLAEIEGQLQQNLRHERRQQAALESILESQNKTLLALELNNYQEMPPPMEALMSLAENFALAHIAGPDTPESVILYNKLCNLMNCFDLGLVSETGVQFDPEKHEACGARRELDSQDGLVLEIVRPGFTLRGKMLRHATVVVNRHDFDNINDGYSAPNYMDTGEVQ